MLVAWMPVRAWAQEPLQEALSKGFEVDTLVVAASSNFQLKPYLLEASLGVWLNGDEVDASRYTVDAVNGLLTLLPPLPVTGTELIAIYDRLPFDFKESYQRNRVRPPDSLVAEDLVTESEARINVPTNTDVFGPSTIQRSGSITRGVVAGNARDVSVESGLRLQLAGEIAEGIQVQAALTDQSTPIQPEGTTQRINEFDKVFIEIQARGGTAQLGDFELRYDQGTLNPFYRKLQGAHVFGSLPLGPNQNTTLTVDVAGATTRGIFQSQQIIPVDGVQGPYRLEGANGERFIIILAGSEVVYLDGQEMVRGELNDYTIDYATGEVTFTPARLITDDRRITIEFQYTTSEFNRTLVGSMTTLSIGQVPGGEPRAQLGISFLREADGDLFNEEFGFTAADSLRVIGAGDNEAVRSGAEPVVFDPEAPYVQYTLEPQLRADGTMDTVFVALSGVPEDSVQVFRVRFSRVGAGNGSYQRLGRGVNGILYEYQGEGQGEYEPVRILPRPVNRNVLSTTASFGILKGLRLYGEWGRSFFDQNRLSGLDSEDDVGNAYEAGLHLDPIPIAWNDRLEGSLSGKVGRRFLGAFYSPFNRVRDVEFGRKWNVGGNGLASLSILESLGDETSDQAQLQVNLSPVTFINAEYGQIELGEAFSGSRRQLQMITGQGRASGGFYRAEWVESEDARLLEMGRWNRQAGEARLGLFGDVFIPRIQMESENRRQRVSGTDSLVVGSLAFLEVRPGFMVQGEKMDWSGEVEIRTEDGWTEGRLQQAATAMTYQSSWSYRPGNRFNTDATLGYRTRRFTPYFRETEQRENNESLVLRWDSRWTPFNRALDIDGRYEAATERTPTLQELYILTGPELGEYVWEDDNEDGVIQIDEFLPERTPNEGTYVRSFIPSDSLSSVINVQARLRLGIDPARVWRDAPAGVKRWLSKVSSRTTIDILEKNRTSQLADIYLLKSSALRDAENTLNGRLRISQEVFLFRSERKYGVDFLFNQARSLTELAAGEEERFLNRFALVGRLAPGNNWSYRLNVEQETNRVLSAQFASRRFGILSRQIEPEVTLQATEQIRVATSLILSDKQDRIAGRSAQLVRIPLRVDFNRVRKTQIQLSLESALVSLDGEASGLAQYELTDGRGNGRSWLWGIRGNHMLSEYLRLTFSYDGRAPADAPVVHTARMQLSALF